MVRTYTNKQGQTILKQVQLNQTINGTMVSWLETYYIYDQYGRLVYQVSPSAMAAVGNATSFSVASNSATDELVYKYNYDSLGRIVEKKVPGSGWQYIIYDKLGRVALTQDANQRSSNQWIFVKYDALNRPVYSGIYTESVLSSRKTMQKYYIGLNYPSLPYYETRAVNATYQGYSNAVFPTTNLQVLFVNYYDDYNFDNSGTANYTYDNTHLSGIPTAASVATRNLPTGQKRLMLGTSNWLIKAIFYDQYDRPIQIQSNNHLTLAVQDKSSFLYKDLVHVDRTKTTHVGATTVNVIQRYTYDNAWRTAGIFHTINSNSEQQVAAYQYNALGQLIMKQLHNTGATFLQNVDMRYNIRGWLSSINNAKLTSDGGVTNNDTNDYFGMELFYNQTDSTSSLNNTLSYNGNISAVKWKGPGYAAGNQGQRSFNLTYDQSDKLVSASFKANATSAYTWTKEAGTLNESVTYDYNGNITGLQRYQNQRGLTYSQSQESVTVTSSPLQIDNLTYSYTPGTNQLVKVTDATSNPAGFTDGASLPTEYSFGPLGNLTADQNKGISSTTYNVLGKPQQVTFTNGTSVVYTYDAQGNKLRAATTVSGVTTITDYVNGFVYNNSTLKFFSSPEGRVAANAGGYEYQYAITDHQGNTRLLFTSAPQAAQSVTATFESAAQATESTQFLNYPTGSHVNNVIGNATFGTSSEWLNGGASGQIGVANSYQVMPGDSVKITAFAKYNAPSQNSANLAGFATALLGAFALSAPAQGETGTPSAGINSWGSAEAGAFGDGTNDSSDPKAFVTILIFDKNYNFLDVAYSQLTSSGKMSAGYLAKEAGYAYLYISNEQAYQTDIYFDNVTMRYKAGPVLQQNEYYPFGLQTSGSWTRASAVANEFLANGGTELNPTTGVYDLDFRNYDPALARMNQVDPMADKYSSHSPYNYAFNSPIVFNDPNGADPPHKIGDDSGTGPNHGSPIPYNASLQSLEATGNSFYQDFITGGADINYSSSGQYSSNGAGGIYLDSNNNGIQDAGESNVSGWVSLTTFYVTGYFDNGKLIEERSHQYSFETNDVYLQDLTQDDGVTINVTNRQNGYAYVRGYPNRTYDNGKTIAYKVPLYDVDVTYDGVTTTFQAIRFAVQTRGSSPMMQGVQSGEYDVTFDPNYHPDFGGSWHVDGALNGGVFFHNGPPQLNWVGAGEGCIQVFGPNCWTDFNGLLNQYAPPGSGVSVRATFEYAPLPPVVRGFTY